MKMLFCVLTISLAVLCFQFSSAETSEEKLDLNEWQIKFAQNIKDIDGVIDGRWLKDDTIDIIVQSNWFGANSKEKAKIFAEFIAPNLSFFAKKEICVNILYPSGNKLTTVCEDDRNSE